MNKTKKILPLFLMCLILSLIIFPSKILASSEFDANKDVEFTIDYQNEGKRLSNAEFDIYKVADVDKDLNIKLTEEFSKYPVDLTKLNQDGWNDYALTLKGYVQSDGVKPLQTGITDAKGIYKTKLKAGLYLVMGKNLTLDNYIYESSPFIVLLPNVEKETGTWNYDVISKPKTTRNEKIIKEVSKKVIKIWKDKGFENLRPKEIEIELLGNGKLRETIVLSEKNNWQHTWHKLDESVNWTLVEKGVDKGKYKVSISEEGDIFIVENTYIPPKTPPKTPPKKPKEPLPQTGQLWWPVYTLVGLGSVMIVLGFIQNRRKKVDE
ncbi:Cna B-type domain-containing protein [Enterococcus faecalis]|uniref:Cna B-type domain-containing protein n=1 Tax=Enterococcus faecalis TaxID=1351 RepID=UPI0021E82F1B|nr:Cna B-type domain-containing protein [Enterococcus faecalis]MCV3151303.1 Cna B-type domain-containing protein [Enterococcus faecalis]MCV3172715.1 Cna B-type domain-containing protein [Enterococcus faecalis]